MHLGTGWKLFGDLSRPAEGNFACQSRLPSRTGQKRVPHTRVSPRLVAVLGHAAKDKQACWLLVFEIFDSDMRLIE
jgi:hypothetical protein